MALDIEEQYEKIYRYCFYRLHSREQAEDITQETFLRWFASDTYTISEDTLREIGGVIFRKTCLVGGTYYKKFMPDELKKLAESEGC